MAMIFFTVPQGRAVIIERFGKARRVLKAGLHMKWPVLDQFARMKVRDVEYATDTHGETQRRVVLRESRYVDLREVVDDYPKQLVITRDNAAVGVDSVIYYQIVDPIKAVYHVENLTVAIEKLTTTTLRDVVGSLDLDDCLRGRDTINTRLREILDEATDPWGVRVTRVEIKDIQPPPDTEDAMRLQMQAERERRADILRAEGKKQALILEAEGKRDYELIQAEGRRKAIEQLLEVTKSGDSRVYLALEALETLKQMADGQATKLFIPYQIADLLSGLASIQEMLTDVKTGQPSPPPQQPPAPRPPRGPEPPAKPTT